MKQHIEQVVSRFLSDYLEAEKPLLIALSGGPDSLALLFLVRALSPLPLAIAHIDHGWREESKEEARQLEALAHELALPFHCTRLEPTEGNKEEKGRIARTAFFSTLCKEHGYQGVLLGHHADDQAETVLKRVFEGAPLSRLEAMAPSTEWDGLRLFRPLLSIRKKELLAWVESRGLHPFEDPTNHSSQFLRGRLRTQLMPLLSEQFGKDPTLPLCRLAAEASGLSDWLQELCSSYLAKSITGPWGSMLDLSGGKLHPYLLQELIRLFCLQQQVDLSHQERLALASGRAALSKGGKKIIADRGRLFIATEPPPLPDLPLQWGEQQHGPWKVTLTKEHSSPLTGWEQLWQGKLCITLPEGNYWLKNRIPGLHYPGRSSLSSWWNKHKVPSFLANYIPLICRNNTVFHEFLSGKTTTLQNKNKYSVVFEIPR